MMPGIEPIATNGVGFLALTTGLALFAWSRYSAAFVHALALAGIVMVLSWLSPRDLLALIAFQIIPFVAVRWIWGKKDGAPTGLVAAVIGAQVLLFLVFKQYAWFDLLGVWGLPVAVIGISYILFRQIHLLIEAPFLGHHPFSLSRYLAFTLSPWTLIAGPIQRYDGFCKGLETVGRPASDVTLAALHRIVSGLIKAFVLAPLFYGPSDAELLAVPGSTWVDFATVFYSYPIYLYLNFSGYVDTVIGVASLCGFTNMTENFNRPYLARNVRDFWTRWHITLGIWVRHYIFTPLSSALIRRTPPALHRIMMAIAILVAFFLVGVWHGTTPNFIVFGMAQGIGIVLSATFEGMLRSNLGRERAKALHNNMAFHAASVLLTFHFTCASFLLLENSLDDLAHGLGAFFF